MSTYSQAPYPGSSTYPCPTSPSFAPSAWPVNPRGSVWRPSAISSSSRATLPMDLREIDGTTVRKLSIKFCDSLTTLRAVATFFPSVTHLSIHGSVFIRPKSRWSRAFRKVVRRVFPRRIANRISPICPRVEDVIPLFPELEDLSGSSFPHGIAASSLQDIRARFPKLRRLEPFDL
ncbi:hypothetical protein EDB83DRAFT_1232640 [Lactarius deliciosus]|nr:hypothetical protein EDB83DRAFT_1232640 [Lactarius deliciosus]